MVKIFYTLDWCYMYKESKCGQCSSGTIKLCCTLINTCIHKFQPLVQTNWGANSITWKAQSTLCYLNKLLDQLEWNSGSNQTTNFKIRQTRSTRLIRNYKPDYSIVWHKIQLLINHIYNKFHKCSVKMSFWAKTYVVCFISIDNCRKHWKESH